MSDVVRIEVKRSFRDRSWWKIVAAVLGVIVVFWGVCAVLPRRVHLADNPMRRADDGLPMLIAHGGGNLEFPDNTLEAFINAYSIDRDAMLETDVSITRDGVIVLSHDRAFSRKTNHNAHIIDTDYSYLMENGVDFGFSNRIVDEDGLWADDVDADNLTRYRNYLGNEVTPLDVDYSAVVEDGLISADALPRHESKFLATTLRDLLVTFPDNYINVEIKQTGQVGLAALAAVITLMQELEDEGNATFNRVVLASFHREVFDRLIEYKNTNFPQIMYSPEATGVTKYFILQALGLDIFYNDDVAAFQVPMSQSGINLATRGFVRRAHRHNIAVQYWTINDADEMAALIKIGADGIMTDRPTLLKEVLDAHQ